MNPLLKLKEIEGVGICSVCSANPYVIKASMQHALDKEMVLLLESTSNQVNQFGGYTNMTPQDFKNYVDDLAETMNFPKDKLILGGDHLGPLIWTEKDPEEAMQLAETLVYDYVKAGFTKIHLDTSMRLRDDQDLSDATIAERGARLAIQVQKAFEERQEEDPKAVFPALIIGSEVPIPGGAQEVESIEVTKTTALDETLAAYEKAFQKYEVGNLLEHIIAVVVQPGVEFGDHQIDRYIPEKAETLVEHVRRAYPNLVLEGHSTDYQTKEDLRKMVEDRISILKVGPALTFALREALYNFEAIERYLGHEKSSDFAQVLDNAMVQDPKHWQKHYHQEGFELKVQRMFSFSDRSRYYLSTEPVQKSIEILQANIDAQLIPLPLLSQYFPIQYRKIIDNDLSMSFEAILYDYIGMTLEDYFYASRQDQLT